MPAESGLTEYIAEFSAGISFQDIPTDVMALGKKSILDVLGPTLTGSTSKTSHILRSYLSKNSIPGEATVIGTDLKLGARFAALANGTAMHVDDYDDTLQAMTGKFEGIHPTAAVLAALLAAAETDAGGDRSGANLLTAFHVGAEVCCKIFDATANAHIVNGFHSTGSCAVLGAAVAVARLRSASPKQMQITLGLAASQAAGLSENFGTMTKPFHAGRSAETAIMAADLVSEGFTASSEVLEARRGFFQAYGGGWIRENIEGRLGAPWSFADRGVSLKPWPTGSLSHPAMTLFLDLVETHAIDPNSVAKIKLRTSENIHHALKHHRPHSELEGKFSLEFCIASIILNRSLTLQAFTDDYVNSDAIQRLIEKVEYSTFSEAEAREENYKIVTTFGEILCTDGRHFSGRRDYGKGAKLNPMSDAEVAQKFQDCAKFIAWPQQKAASAINLIEDLEHLPDIRTLTACLASDH